MHGSVPVVAEVVGVVNGDTLAPVTSARHGALLMVTHCDASAPITPATLTAETAGVGLGGGSAPVAAPIVTADAIGFTHGDVPAPVAAPIVAAEFAGPVHGPEQLSSIVPRQLGVWLGLAAITVIAQTAVLLTSDALCENHTGSWQGQRLDLLMYSGPKIFLSPWCMVACVASLIDHRGRFISSSTLHRLMWWYALVGTAASFHMCSVVGAYCNALGSSARTAYRFIQQILLFSCIDISEFLFTCTGLLKLRAVAKKASLWKLRVVVMTGHVCFVASTILLGSRLMVGVLGLSSPVFIVLDLMVQVAWATFFMCVVLTLCFTARVALSQTDLSSNADVLAIQSASALTHKTACATAICALTGVASSAIPTHLGRWLVDSDHLLWAWLISSVCSFFDAAAHVVAAQALAGMWSPTSTQRPSLEKSLEIVAEACVLREVNVQDVCRKWISQDELAKWQQMFIGTIGEVFPLDDYVPSDTYGHYRLGITCEGMLLVLQRIGFILPRSGSQTQRPHSGLQSCDLKWVYCSSADYQRGEAKDWLDRDYGAVTDGGPCGRSNMTGYDACIYIRQWLEKSGSGCLSLAEVVLLKKEWKDLRAHVGFASVLWSHLQSEPLIGPRSTLSTIEQYLQRDASAHSRGNTLAKCCFPWLSRQQAIYIWCDYFCLRQAWSKPAFQTLSVVEAIRSHGKVVACIDEEMSYLRRSFCLLEVFAACVGGCRLQCIAYTTERDLAQKPVDSKAALTRYPADKEEIDKLIETTVGMLRLDSLLTDSILHGLTHDGR